MQSARNASEPVPARLAGAMIVCTAPRQCPELLFIRRPRSQRFGGGQWVFPGGAVETQDGAGDPVDQLRRTAIRETAEETAVSLAVEDEFPLLFHWITPASVPIRFDARFYLAWLPERPRVVPADGEVVDWCWRSAGEALQLWESGAMKLMHPTVKSLQILAKLGTMEKVLTFAAAQFSPPIQPCMGAADDGSLAIMLPPAWQEIEALADRLSSL